MDNKEKQVASIIDIIDNKHNAYIGNLHHYFRVIMFKAKNLANPYHNLRHMLHVLWVSYQACLYYKHELDERETRNILIAALFHDMNHSGVFGNDHKNIKEAIRALKENILEEDKPFIKAIIFLIECTEYPHVIPDDKLNLCAMILRDADMSQSLNEAWYQQIIIGFSRERNLSILDTFKLQVEFHENSSFYTDWAKQVYSREKLKEKIDELKRVIAILEA